MFKQIFTPAVITYPFPAKGWENGIYQERRMQVEETTWEQASAGEYCLQENHLMLLKSRMWTETEHTGFGIYPYAEGLAFCIRTGLNDGTFTFTLANPTDTDYKASVLANGILKINAATIPAHGEQTLSFLLCSIEETTFLQFFVPTELTEKDDTALSTIYLRDIRYEKAAPKTKKEKPTVFLASDSTVQTYEDFYYPQTGWGQVFWQYFARGNECKDYLPEDAVYPQCHVYELPDITIENRSIGARSSRSFINEGKWDALLQRANPGDYCLIQWAHNDATAVRPNRFVAVSDFAYYLQKYIDSCRSRGIHILMVTPVSRRNCDEHNGEFALSFGEYRDVCVELGKEEHVPVIDLCVRSNDYLKKVGSEEAKLLHLWCAPGAYPEGAYADGVSDNTHLQEYGAKIYAKMVADSILEQTDYPELDFLKAIISTDIIIEKPIPPVITAAADPEVPSGFALQELHIENKIASFLLVWNDVADAVSYNVYRKGTIDFQFFPLRSVSSEEKTGAAVLPFQLPAADVYQVYVTAVFANGRESAPSRKIEFRA